MRIALIGPTDLSEFDKKEIEENLNDFISKGNEIVILAYRSIEIEVFKYFVKNIDDNKKLASKLHIYTFQDFDKLPQKLKTSIDYLVEEGANYHTFGYNEMKIERSIYQDSWKFIIEDCDIVISFYDGIEKSLKKLFIPIDIAKSLNKKGIIYNLPGTSEEKFLLEPEEKIRIVE